MLSKVLIFFIIIMFTFMIGCSGGKKDAVTVAEDFWNALQDRDLERARSHATKETAGSLTLNENAEDQEVDIAFGEVVEEDGYTKIETTIQTTTEESETSVALLTVLIREEGEWKVDVNQTMMSMFGEAMEEMVKGMTKTMEELGKTMTEEMQKSMEQMAGSMQEN